MGGGKKWDKNNVHKIKIKKVHMNLLLSPMFVFYVDFWAAAPSKYTNLTVECIGSKKSEGFAIFQSGTWFTIFEVFIL